MAKLMHGTGRSLEVRVERIAVSTALPRPDPNWTYTDHAGHEHAYTSHAADVILYRNLVLRTGEPYWCPDCQDEHTDSWLECPQCGEKITPGTYVDTTPQYIAGQKSYLIDGQPASKAEGDALLVAVSAARDEEERARLAAQAMRMHHSDRQMVDFWRTRLDESGHGPRHVEAARGRLTALSDTLTAGPGSSAYDLASTLIEYELLQYAGHPDYQEDWRP